jgi:hypothetical protein
MKRRDFIELATMGAAGSLTPTVWGGQPCPPSPLVLDGGSRLEGLCSSTTAPNWFNNMADRTWATPVTNTLDSVRPANPPGIHAAICNAWTGACVDQQNGEYILAANGGHGDYAGNEVYACALRQDSPSWVRLTDPSSTGGGTDGTRTPMNYADGKPRAVHGYNRCTWGNGRVWYAGMDGASPSGAWSLACYSFKRSTREWTYHGIPANNTSGSYSWEGGPAAYDRVGNRVWSVAQYGLQDGGYSVDCSTGAMTPHNWVLSGNPFGQAWSVIAHDLRLWIVGSVTEGKLKILNLNNVGAGWTTITTSGAPDGFAAGTGAVYHPPSRAILVWNTSYGGSIRKLAIPGNPLSGTYAWSTVIPASANTISPPGQLDSDFRGAYSKFNLIEDMGNGRSALVFVGRTTGQTFVYKLPAAGV